MPTAVIVDFLASEGRTYPFDSLIAASFPLGPRPPHRGDFVRARLLVTHQFLEVRLAPGIGIW